MVKKDKILVVGKAAYHFEFSISDEFSILTNKDNKNTTTNGTDVKRTFDGMAANIAYGLSILGSHPIIVSQGGYDFDCFYRPHLEKAGIEVRPFIDPEKETACWYKIRDKQGNVLIIHQDNCYRFFAESNLEEKFKSDEFQSLDSVFIGTGKVEADTKFLSVVNEQNKRLPVIYSPDSNIHELTKWRLSQIFNKITVLVCTEDELRVIEERMKQTCNEILTNSKRLKYIISMMFREKIVIHSKEFKMKVSEGPAAEVLSDDSWQDAFRAGIVYGVSLKKPIDEAAKIGSALASYAVENRENQQYSPSLEQVSLRAFEVKTKRKEK